MEETRLKVGPEVVTLLILIGVGLLGGSYVAFQSVTTPPRPPDFTVPTTDNETFTLTNHTGEVVILDLFATWCASCQIVEGNLKENLAEWEDLPVTILSLGIDPTETMDDFRAYKRAHNITWIVGQDTDGVKHKYNTFEIARVVIFDVDGNVVFERSGVTSADEFRDVVDDALAGRRAPLGLVQYSMLGLAMVAGAAAFFSPCAVGMLPAYVLRAVDAGPGSVTRALKVGGLEVEASGKDRQPAEGCLDLGRVGGGDRGQSALPAGLADDRGVLKERLLVIGQRIEPGRHDSLY